MKIKKIKIENFKSIYEPLEIDFEQVSGFWKISGSVGSGKTTIGEAIIYGLFGSVGGKNNGDLISWGRKHGLVEVWCVSKGHNIYIKRELNSYGQSPIYVEVDGDELVFTNKRDAQQQLESEYYDTSKMTLELLCIISFNNFKSLATLNTADTKKFLDQVLGFYTLTEYAEICKTLKSNNLYNMSNTINVISQLKSQVKKLEEISNIEVIDGDIDEVLNDLTLNSNLYDAITGEMNDEVALLTSNQVSLRQKEASIITLGKNKKKEIEFIEKGVCPTCGAPIDQSQLEVKRKEKDLLFDQYQDIQSQIKGIEQQIIGVKKEANERLGIVKETIDEDKKLLTKLREQARRLDINKGEITSINKTIKKHEKEVVKYQKEDAEWEQLYNILTSQVRSSILQSFIPSLNRNILKYTQRLHLPYIIEFDSNFKCNIGLCGLANEVPVSSLSTGQLKTVDMVIILGVLGTVIGSNGINILFLDELFSNLDSNLRNEMCMLLKETISPDTTIFIISHTELEDRYFDGNIHMRLELKGQYEKHSICKIEKFEGDH